VALETLVGEDRPDVALKIDFFLGIGQRRQQGADKEGTKKKSPGLHGGP
jgi:hypothetical protein